MKRLFFFACLLTVSLSLQAQELLVGSYNIRYDNPDDVKRGNGWMQRLPVISDLLTYEDPDIFGVQEALAHQVADLQRSLPAYDYVGVGREDGKEQGEYAAVFYRRDRFKRLRSGHFWLSETPERPSFGWDAACMRICSWVELEDQPTKRRLFFFNLHLDHVGKVARLASAHLVLSKIQSLAGASSPVILTGDFNVDQTDEVYSRFVSSSLLQDGYTLAEHRFAPNGTFNAFDTELLTPSRIDHVFVSSAFRVLRYAIRTDSYWTALPDAPSQGSDQAPVEVRLKKHVRRAPSDHYPVFVKLCLLK